MNTVRAPTLVDDTRVATNPLASAHKRVVIVGGGFAGIAAARALRHAEAEILLLDRRNHHIFQPLLYQVATAILSSADTASPIRQMEAKQRNLRVLLGEVTAISPTDRTIDVTYPGEGTRTLGFDFLVVATGARPSYFGHDEFQRYAPALKNLSDAEAIRSDILSAFERAETTDDEDERARQMTFVLVGAGPTGVELAASLAQMVKTTLRGNYRRIDPARAKIILLDGASRILPSFSESVSRRVTKRLARLDVVVATDVTVDAVGDESVTAGGKEIACATVLWTAGVAASPLVKLLGAETDRAGRALVDPFLRVAGTSGVFVVGDAASVAQNGHPLPGVAQVAIQEGRYVGRLIAGELKGRTPKRPFRYVDLGNMAVVGNNYAVIERGWLRAGGFLVWLLWSFVHILTLPQMQNRLRVQRQWLWSYFTGQRSARLIPEPPPAHSDRQGSAGEGQ